MHDDINEASMMVHHGGDRVANDEQDADRTTDQHVQERDSDDLNHGDLDLEDGALPAPVPDDVAERILAVGETYEPDEIAALRREWAGPEMNRNLGYVKAFLDAYVPAELQSEIPDSVTMLRLGAHVARQVFLERATPRPTDKRSFRGTMDGVDRDLVLDQAMTYRRLRDAAQLRGDRRNVLRYDEKERQILGHLDNATAVGHGRYTA